MLQHINVVCGFNPSTTNHLPHGIGVKARTSNARLFDGRPRFRLRPSKLIPGLEVHPEFGRRTKCIGKPHRSLRGDTSLAADDFANQLSWTPDDLRKIDLRPTALL